MIDKEVRGYDILDGLRKTTECLLGVLAFDPNNAEQEQGSLESYV
jgi:hypothetical protein